MAIDLPHLVRSHKYGGALMTQPQFRALEALPDECAQLVALAPPRLQQSAALFLANRIRVRCCARTNKDIPAEHAEECLVLVRELRADTERHLEQGGQIDRAYIEHTIGGSVPWTASVVRKLHRPLPERPDWRALQEEIDARVKVVPIAMARAKAAPPQARDQDLPLEQLAAQISQDMAALMGRVAMLNYRLSQRESIQEAA